MCIRDRASNVTFELNVHDIAYLDEAISYAKMGLVPAGAYKNKGYSYQKVDFRNVEDHFIDLLYDPQTSGGLLISVEAQYADCLLYTSMPGKKLLGFRLCNYDF